MAIPLADQMVRVTLPSLLREQIADQRILYLPCGTIDEVIDALDARFPGLRFNLCLETGELRQFINVFLDGVNIRYQQGLATVAPAGATLLIVPSVAGG